MRQRIGALLQILQHRCVQFSALSVDLLLVDYAMTRLQPVGVLPHTRPPVPVPVPVHDSAPGRAFGSQEVHCVYDPSASTAAVYLPVSVLGDRLGTLGVILRVGQDEVVVDEATMVDDRPAEVLSREADRTGTKLIGIGDPLQLQAIAAGGRFREAHRLVGGFTLTENRRQEDAAERHALEVWGTGDHDQALRLLDARSPLGSRALACPRVTMASDAAVSEATWRKHQLKRPRCSCRNASRVRGSRPRTRATVSVGDSGRDTASC
ncbi:AAA family ATPase [Streptomyces anulatus]|uniref:AAA family ATPase n=1 Tax=Streptomyces anulatus TaxID=1892 RepID=UPI00386DA745